MHKCSVARDPNPLTRVYLLGIQLLRPLKPSAKFGKNVPRFTPLFSRLQLASVTDYEKEKNPGQSSPKREISSGSNRAQGAQRTTHTKAGFAVIARRTLKGKRKLNVHADLQYQFPILDQGQEGACTGFALASSFKQANYGDRVPVSPRGRTSHKPQRYEKVNRQLRSRSAIIFNLVLVARPIPRARRPELGPQSQLTAMDTGTTQ